MTPVDPATLLTPGRKITGMSAILLPFLSESEVDWDGFERHVQRTFDAGLVPAVNMDTGYANLIDAETRLDVLRRTRSIAAGKMFVAGAFVGDHPGDAFDLSAYQCAIDQLQSHGGTPILFQSFGLTELDDDATVDAYVSISESCDSFIFFELGEMFAPFGKIYPLEVYGRLMQIPKAVGAKHSSLNRQLEWQRLALRNATRPEFMVLTGNDLAIDMVIYGSDYLLGLSSFAPKGFAFRDSMWAERDSRFYELNDLLQYLGAFAFRAPTPAYKHSAAMFLKLRNWIATDATHPDSPIRPETDRAILQQILDDLESKLAERI